MGWGEGGGGRVGGMDWEGWSGRNGERGGWRERGGGRDGEWEGWSGRDGERGGGERME